MDIVAFWICDRCDGVTCCPRKDKFFGIYKPQSLYTAAKRLRMLLRFVKCRKSFFNMPLNNAPEMTNGRNERASNGVAREPLTQRDLDYKKWMERVLSQDPQSSLYRDTDETDAMEMLPERPRDNAGPQNNHGRKAAAKRWYRARQPDDSSELKAGAIARRRERKKQGGVKHFPAGEAVYGSVPNESDEQRLRSLYADVIAAKGPVEAHVAYGINETQRDSRLQMGKAISPLEAIQLLSTEEMKVLTVVPDADKRMVLAHFVRVKTASMLRVMRREE